MIIFWEIVQRGVDVVQTQKLRMVLLPHPLAICFHEGMTKANTDSHDPYLNGGPPVARQREALSGRLSAATTSGLRLGKD